MRWFDHTDCKSPWHLNATKHLKALQYRIYNLIGLGLHTGHMALGLSVKAINLVHPIPYFTEHRAADMAKLLFVEMPFHGLLFAGHAVLSTAGLIASGMFLGAQTIAPHMKPTLQIAYYKMLGLQSTVVGAVKSTYKTACDLSDQAYQKENNNPKSYAAQIANIVNSISPL